MDESTPSEQLFPESPRSDAPGRLVHVAWRWERVRDARDVVGRGIDWTGATGVALAVGTVAALSWIDRVVAGGILGWVFLPAILGALITPYALRHVRLPKAPPWVRAAIDEWPRDRFRLRLIAGPRIAEYLRHLGDGASEPQIFRIASNGTGVRHTQLLPVLFLICAIAFAGLLVALLAIAWNGPFVPLLLAWMIVVAIWAFAWPTYLRLAPGRLDVFHFGFLGSGKPLVESYDLMSSRLLLDTHRKLVFLEPPDGRRDLIHYGSILKDLAFAKALLEAARSTRAAPPLPDDALTG